MKTKIRLLSLAIIALFFVAKAQTKDAPYWVINYGQSQKYPSSKYLVGFGSASGTDSDAYKIAQDNARADVARTIIVHVESEFSTFTEEDSEKFSRYINSVTQSSTSIQIMGLQAESYVDKKSSNPTIYVLSYVRRADLNRIYSKKRSDRCRQINKLIEDARADERNSKSVDAAMKYLSLYPFYEEFTEAETILMASSQSSSIKDVFDELDQETSRSAAVVWETPLMSQIEVTNQIDQLLSQSMGSMNDVARAVVLRLSMQIDRPSRQVLITPFTYQDTKMSSRFARYFRSLLETQLGQANWSVADQATSFRPKSRQITRSLAENSGAGWLLSGTYWEQGEKVKLMTPLRDVKTGKLLAGIEIAFDAAIVKSAGLNLKPENYESALIDQQAFREDEIVSRQLQVDVWTNKGNDNLLFTNGEDMMVYIRVNRPAHVRLLYILADGQYTLLYDDLYIDQSKVNHAVEVPEVFECASPFGAEMLIVVARVKKFEPLKTVEKNGYFFLKVANARDAAAQVRGMKKKKKKDDEIRQTEAKIVITTMEKG